MVPSVNIVTGKVLKDKRAAVIVHSIVHDGKMVFLLKGGTKKPEPPWLPQAQLRIEVSTSATETAVRALNSYVTRKVLPIGDHLHWPLELGIYFSICVLSEPSPARTPQPGIYNPTRET